jgi:hypothetical protein
MKRTPPLLAAVALLVACNRSQVASPRYALDIFSEDTLQAHVTVTVTGPLEVSLNGAGFYTVNKTQPVVLTPASLVVRGTGAATISAIDSMQSIAVVPSGTHPDSTDAIATVGRILRISRSEGQAAYKVEIARPRD